MYITFISEIDVAVLSRGLRVNRVVTLGLAGLAGLAGSFRCAVLNSL